ncbi:hypothetical protein JKF63_03044 [Porcisia hertigi]|uniref:Reticulon-like protein n=1 Tax=Porcisia hertigi TaxID=2761500 RepID=A0A836L4R4_9TRYP|nr:hypothetical protein JKF63_03044 [Porcisia hertigi]
MSAIVRDFKGLTTNDVVTWRRPIASGIICTSLFATWAVFVFAEYTLTTFLSRIASALFIIGGAAALTKHTFMTSPDDVSASMDRVYEAIRPYVKKSVNCAVSLLTWRDYMASAKFFAATLMTAFLGNWMSDTTLILFTLVVTFTAPLVYDRKQKEIEQAVEQVRAYANKYIGMITTQVDAKRRAFGQQSHDMERKAQ